ncbi:hypothetical protein PHMEG_00017114 [Phytophthora megakarya]|uniref:Uncharacterized protein n=1 Tax=Phytophthora megakarya TaxID=4795 RepID=A0A225VXL6_9STRA|nr:hypothetical protein PHMEG_00017114 [Phytophthora megakarya]
MGVFGRRDMQNDVYGGTARTAHHLRLVHNLSTPKTDVEVTGTRKRDSEIQNLRASPLYANSLSLLNLLLGTQRIIYHNLPFKISEYNESRLLEALVVKEKM